MTNISVCLSPNNTNNYCYYYYKHLSFWILIVWTGDDYISPTAVLILVHYGFYGNSSFTVQHEFTLLQFFLLQYNFLYNNLVLHDGQHVILGTHTFDRHQSLLVSLRVIEKEGQKTVRHGYRRNLKEHVVGLVNTLARKYKNSDMLDISSGCHGTSKISASLFINYSTLQNLFIALTRRIKHYKAHCYRKTRTS